MWRKRARTNVFSPSAPIAIAPHFQHSCAKSRSYYSSKDAISPLLELGVFFFSLSFSSISRKRRREEMQARLVLCGRAAAERGKGQTDSRKEGREG